MSGELKMLYKFRSHPNSGFYDASGRLITSEVNAVSTVSTKSKKIITTADVGGVGGGGVPGSGSAVGSGFGNNSQMGGSGGLSSFGGGSSGANTDRYNPVRDFLEEGSVVEDWIPRDAAGLNEMFMLMYHRDPYAGIIVDLIAETIWCDFDLTGITDRSILKIYEDSMSSIDVLTTMPDITREYLVLGRSISSLIFDKDRGIFKDLVSHDPSTVRLTPIPIKGFDPKIDLIPSPALRAFVDSQDSRDIDARKMLPETYLNAVRAASSGATRGGFNSQIQQHAMGTQSSGGIPLDPVNTLFVARKVFNYDMIGTSLYTRLISFWALEKALINASVTSARRRSRSILHIQAGIDNVWEPSAQEIDNIAGMFIQADDDPVGAVVTTRTGVTTSEVRQGQDFYKWSDEWTLLTEGKLRALGANDAILCLTGDTLIPTKEHGLIRIDTFGTEATKTKITTTGRNGEDITTKWLYSGRGEVIEIKTYNGNTIKCTPGHQVLVLDNNDLVWKRSDDLKLNDVLCLSKEKCIRVCPLKLELTTVPKKKYANSFNAKVLKPLVMTPDLAYLLGITVSEGCVGKYRWRISNSNLDILEGVKTKILNVFGPNLKITISKCSRRVGDKRVDKHGVEWNITKQPYELCVWSMVVTDYLRQLGICVEPGKQSRRKTVPWSILQADEESQLSYLAAYIDGDGTVHRGGKEIIIYSFSKYLLVQTQILLNAHGIDSLLRHKTIRMTCGNSVYLRDKLSKYSLSGKFNGLAVPEFPDREYGILTNGINTVLKERFVRKLVNVGSVFHNDDGQEVIVKRFGRITTERWKHLLYSSHQAGDYNEFLNGLKQISLSEYKKVISLFSKKFKYTKVVKIEKLDNEVDLYDIQMASDPSFVANGIVVHNSGDATYSNQEAAKTFFMERAVNLRRVLTKRVYIDRMFPLLARIHGFIKRSKAELDHRIRITQRESMDIPSSELITPDVRWRKELINNVDDKRLEVYEKMEEKGFPITFRNWASAANMDLDDQMSDLEADGEMRKKVKYWKAKFNSDEQEDVAKLEMLTKLKSLSQTNLRQVVGSLVEELGPLNSYLFWDERAEFCGVQAKILATFLKEIDPSSNSVRILLDPLSLAQKLVHHFKDGVKAEIAHYLLYRTELTPLTPALSPNAVGLVQGAVQTALDKYALHGNVYQLAKVADKELRIVSSLTKAAKDAAVDKIDKLAKKVSRSKNVDTIASSSPNLYAGKD